MFISGFFLQNQAQSKTKEQDQVQEQINLDSQAQESNLIQQETKSQDKDQAQSVQFNIGFDSVILDSKTNKPFAVSVWYPTTQTSPESLIADNSIFIGQTVIQNAKIVAESFPLIVISQGYSDSSSELSWLATALVKKGYIVAIPNYVINTTNKDSAINIVTDVTIADTINKQTDKPKVEFTKLWQRPNEVSRIIDVLTQNKKTSDQIANKLANKFLKHIDADKISIIGFSVGGWTAIKLAGGIFSNDIMLHYCKSNAELASCTIYSKINEEQNTESLDQLSQNQKDPRIKAVITFDSALTRGFTKKSLNEILIPKLVIAASGMPDMELPVNLESKFLVNNFNKSNTEFIKIKSASHFSFIQECQPDAKKILIEQYGNDILCQDNQENEAIIRVENRMQIHRRIAGMITDFLSKSI